MSSQISKRLWLKITVLCLITNIGKGTKPATANLLKFYYEGFDKINKIKTLLVTKQLLTRS